MPPESRWISPCAGPSAGSSELSNNGRESVFILLFELSASLSPPDRLPVVTLYPEVLLLPASLISSSNSKAICKPPAGGRINKTKIGVNSRQYLAFNGTVSRVSEKALLLCPFGCWFCHLSVMDICSCHVHIGLV